MHDLRSEMRPLWHNVARLSTRQGGRAVMFIAAQAGEGTTSVAASFALTAAARVRRSAWLVDLDLRRNQAIRGFSEGFARDIGLPGRAYDASLGTSQFFSIGKEQDADRGRDAKAPKLLTAYNIEDTRLMVTRFRSDRLRPGQQIRLRTRVSWWEALRRATDWIITDAPALERSAAGLVMAGQMDGVILVVRADRTPADDVMMLRSEVEAHGGKVIGVAMNQRLRDACIADRMSG